jgi:hypothetical protein
MTGRAGQNRRGLNLSDFSEGEFLSREIWSSSGRRPCSRSNISAPPLEARTTANWGCCWAGVADGRCYDLDFADHRYGLEVEVAKLFPGRSRTSARWRSRRRRLIVLHDTARMGAVGTAHKRSSAAARAGAPRQTDRQTKLQSPACWRAGRGRPIMPGERQPARAQGAA